LLFIDSPFCFGVFIDGLAVLDDSAKGLQAAIVTRIGVGARVNVCATGKEIGSELLNLLPPFRELFGRQRAFDEISISADFRKEC
jgi:hypothetical protein